MDNPGDLMHLCRLCLVKDQVNIPIFEEHGDIRQIFVKISSCLPVKVSKDDQLPKRICDGCSNKLDLLYEFCNTSANSEKKLLSWLEQAGLKDVDTISAVAQHTAKPLETQTQVKQEALEDIHAAVQQTDHLELTDEGVGAAVFEENAIDESDEPPPPKRARRTAAVKAQINITPDSDDDDDMDISEPMTKVEDESDDSDVDKDPSYVDVPGTSADDQPGPSGVGKDGVEAPYFERSGLETSLKQENYEFPTENHHQNQYNYGDLSGPNSSTINKILENEIEFQKPLNDVNDMKIDLNTIYSIIKQDSNVVTNKIKQKPDALESSTEDERRTNVTGNDKNPEKDPPPVELEEPMECEVCNKTYNNNVAFVLHSVDHHQDNKYYCYLCGYKTMSKYLIEKHIRTHEGTADYICEICNKTFTISTHAKEHKYFHSGKKPFPCNICGNKFMFSWLLRSHKRLRHWEIVNGSPLMNYTCVTCNANYTCSSALKPHNITHHGPDVICDICDKSIKKNQLQIHQRIHIREKPYSCQYCDKYFTQKSSVTLHERIHTGEKSYNCEICQKAFNTKGSRDRHMKTCKKEPK